MAYYLYQQSDQIGQILVFWVSVSFGQKLQKKPKNLGFFFPHGKKLCIYSDTENFGLFISQAQLLTRV
jgi:hypothetical protein